MRKSLSFISLLWIFVLASCGYDQQLREAEIAEYPTYVSDTIKRLYKYPRYIRLAANLPPEVTKELPQALTIANKPLQERFGLKDRYRVYDPNNPPDPDKSVIIDVVNHDGKDHCGTPTPELAALDRDGDRYIVQFCVEKFLRSRFTAPGPDQSRTSHYTNRQASCILAHEFLHSDLPAHLRPNTGCQLMCTVPEGCWISDQALNIFAAVVLPHIDRKEA